MEKNVQCVSKTIFLFKVSDSEPSWHGMAWEKSKKDKILFASTFSDAFYSHSCMLQHSNRPS